MLFAWWDKWGRRGDCHVAFVQEPCQLGNAGPGKWWWSSCRKPGVRCSLEELSLEWWTLCGMDLLWFPQGRDVWIPWCTYRQSSALWLLLARCTCRAARMLWHWIGFLLVVKGFTLTSQDQSTTWTTLQSKHIHLEFLFSQITPLANVSKVYIRNTSGTNQILSVCWIPESIFAQGITKTIMKFWLKGRVLCLAHLEPVCGWRDPELCDGVSLMSLSRGAAASGSFGSPSQCLVGKGDSVLLAGGRCSCISSWSARCPLKMGRGGDVWWWWENHCVRPSYLCSCSRFLHQTVYPVWLVVPGATAAFV